MNDAFGVDREAIAKAVGEEYKAVLEARVARKAAKRAVPKPYYHPSDEQKAAQAARRVQQKSESVEAKAARPYRRRPGKPSPIRSHIHTGPVANVVMSGGLASGAAYALHQEKVHKADNTKRDTALGAVAGAGATDAALTVGGQSTKAHLKRQRERLGVSQHDQKVWNEHKAKFGVTGRSTSHTPNKVKTAMHAAYPKELPGWKAQRALAFKNRAGVTAATIATGAAAGAAYAHKKSIGKAAPGVKGALTDGENVARNVARVGAGVLVVAGVRRKRQRNRSGVSKAFTTQQKHEASTAGGAVVGAGVGQAAYQHSGYALKHHADKYTRPYKGKLDPETAKKINAATKPLKQKYGMGVYAPGQPGNKGQVQDKVGYHRNYPKDLPKAKIIRTLGHTHEGRSGVAVGAATTIAGGGLGLTASHEYQKHKGVSKAFSDQNKKDAAGAVAGGAAGYGVHQASVMKPRRAERKIASDPALKAKYQAHRDSYRPRRNDPAGAEKWRKMYRHYDKSLPGARRQRWIAVADKGHSGAAIKTAAVASGAAAGVAVARHHIGEKMSKSAFGIEHGEIEKGFGEAAAKIGTGVKDFFQGASAGGAGKTIASAPRPGMAGNALNTGNKAGLKARAIGTNPNFKPAAIGAGGGAVVGGGAMAFRNRNRG